MSSVPEIDRQMLAGARQALAALAQGVTVQGGKPVQLRSLEAGCLLQALERAEHLDRLISAPELHDFATGVVLEAAHQRKRWGAPHDAGKAQADWFWLVGFLSGKILQAAIAGDADKALHHCISSAAVLANWHAGLLGVDTTMRPGLAEEATDV